MCNNSIVVRRTTTDYSGPINGLLFARVVAAPLTTPHVSSDRAAWRLTPSGAAGGLIQPNSVYVLWPLTIPATMTRGSRVVYTYL